MKPATGPVEKVVVVGVARAEDLDERAAGEAEDRLVRALEDHGEAEHVAEERGGLGEALRAGSQPPEAPYGLHARRLRRVGGGAHRPGVAGAGSLHSAP
jgi:hypothetical protein